MTSCFELDRISTQKSRALQVSDHSFGGKSVILAGDFAQLAPPGKGQNSLYSASVGPWTEGLTLRSQQIVMGKALWHTFTTVIILCVNMRQRGLSEHDAQLRETLQNVRYKRCKANDFDLLESRTMGKGLSPDVLKQPHLRNVSIVTPLNAHRDMLNETGALRFAAETGQALRYFHSIDRWSSKAVEHHSVHHEQKMSNRQPNTTLTTSNRTISPLQQLLWQLKPCVTDQIPGVLPICRGMPVMLKHNEATELCATNGAEGTVVGWDSSPHPDVDGLEVLDTLYVQLISPPRSVQLPGLPENVIPIATSKEDTECILRDDNKLTIQRRQVRVLLNFGMSDFNSQGRTPPVNPIHITECFTCQSIYTCLSRTSSYDGTYIIGRID
ncbi:hypothetical protein OH76DRAFT_1367345 [Lentinus brumalis]|uniref:ATP-dependent DNA helicase n=1 Tax=Lentinus brumalis TaxID=2498619 RepID=A0A371CH43_9APHY|nr:hypothetical protein OH76DRAFT_1367345 [Polyporus brumalis]